MEPSLKSVLLLSGGIDSLVLLASECAAGRKPVCCLSFDYGQRHKRELEAAANFALLYDVPWTCLSLPPEAFRGSALTSDRIAVPQAAYDDPAQTATIVPNRNLVFLSLAACVAIQVGAQRVLLAAHKDDAAIYPDCRKGFTVLADRTMWAACYIRVSVPFIDLTKKEVVALGKQLNAPMNQAWSCYAGGETPCRLCGACHERRLAFEEETT